MPINTGIVHPPSRRASRLRHVHGKERVVSIGMHMIGHARVGAALLLLNAGDIGQHLPAVAGS